jgi:hypothetical protein
MSIPRRLQWVVALAAFAAALLALRTLLTVPDPKTEIPKGTYYYTGYMKSKAERMRNAGAGGRD